MAGSGRVVRASKTPGRPRRARRGACRGRRRTARTALRRGTARRWRRRGATSTPGTATGPVRSRRAARAVGVGVEHAVGAADGRDVLVDLPGDLAVGRPVGRRAHVAGEVLDVEGAVELVPTRRRHDRVSHRAHAGLDVLGAELLGAAGDAQGELAVLGVEHPVGADEPAGGPALAGGGELEQVALGPSPPSSTGATSSASAAFTAAGSVSASSLSKRSSSEVTRAEQPRAADVGDDGPGVDDGVGRGPHRAGHALELGQGDRAVVGLQLLVVGRGGGLAGGGGELARRRQTPAASASTCWPTTGTARPAQASGPSSTELAESNEPLASSRARSGLVETAVADGREGGLGLVASRW